MQQYSVYVSEKLRWGGRFWRVRKILRQCQRVGKWPAPDCKTVWSCRPAIFSTFEKRKKLAKIRRLSHLCGQTKRPPFPERAPIGPSFGLALGRAS